MIKKDYDKRVYHNFKPYNTEEVEQYLNGMAEKGFYLLEIREHQMFFKKDIPLKVRYSIVFLKNIEERWTYKNYSKSVGWNYIYGTDKFQVYVTSNAEIAFIESDETKFDMLRNVRNKTLLYDVFKLCLLMIAAFFFTYYIGLVSICLKVLGLCLTTMGVLYGVLLISEIVDTVYWKNQCRKKLLTNEKLNFRFHKISKKLNSIVYILLCTFFIILVFDSFYRLLLSWQMDGIGKSKSLFIISSIYIIFSPLIGIYHGDFSKRGGVTSLLLRIGWLILFLMVSSVMVNGFGSGVATYSPEDLQIVYDEEMSSGHIDAGKSVLGSIEYYLFYGSDEEGYGTLDYSYYLYKSKFPSIIKQVKKEALRTEHISEYLTSYKQTDKYTIYTANNKKVYPEDATYKTYDTDLECYDGCILIQGQNELLIFYYMDFKNINIDNILKDLGYKQ